MSQTVHPKERNGSGTEFWAYENKIIIIKILLGEIGDAVVDFTLSGLSY